MKPFPVICASFVGFWMLITVISVSTDTNTTLLSQCSAIVNETECCKESDCNWCFNSSIVINSSVSYSSVNEYSCRGKNETVDARFNCSCAEPTTLAPATAVTTPTTGTSNETTNATTASTHPTVPTTTNGTESPNTTITAAPIATTKQSTVTVPPSTTSSCVPRKGFDGLSFFGGIILGLGICAIVFIGYKYYQSRQIKEAPYRQF